MMGFHLLARLSRACYVREPPATARNESSCSMTSCHPTLIAANTSDTMRPSFPSQDMRTGALEGGASDRDNGAILLLSQACGGRCCSCLLLLSPFSGTCASRLDCASRLRPLMSTASLLPLARCLPIKRPRMRWYSKGKRRKQWTPQPLPGLCESDCLQWRWRDRKAAGVAVGMHQPSSSTARRGVVLRSSCFVCSNHDTTRRSLHMAPGMEIGAVGGWLSGRAHRGEQKSISQVDAVHATIGQGGRRRAS